MTSRWAKSLTRFDLTFENGWVGEYWGASPEAGPKNFPIGKLRIYRVEPLTKTNRPDTLKFSPATTQEIRLFEVKEVPSAPPSPQPKSRPPDSASPPSLAAPPSPQPISRTVAQASASTARTTPTPPTKASVDPKIAAMALSATVDLVKAGKLEVGQIEASVKKLVAMLMGL